MFIIWGTRNIRRHRGYVADFCAICRGIRAFRVSDIKLAHHFFFIPFATVKTVSQMRTCTTCGQHAFPEAGTYDAFMQQAHADIDTLVKETNPTLVEVLADRLALEDKAKQSLDQLSPDERRKLLKEPFVELSGQVAWRFARGGLMGIIRALPLVVALFLACIWIVYSDETKGAMHALVVASGVVAAVLFLVGVCWLATWKRRYMKKRIVPLLGQALAPLQPTEAELAEILHTLKTDGHKIGKKLKPQWIIQAIAAGTLRAPQA